jgi:hypothetical protein
VRQPFLAVELRRGAFADLDRRHAQLAAAAQGLHLRLACALEEVDVQEGFRDGAAGGQQAVVAQDHRAMVAQALHQPLALFEIQRDAFVGVVAEVAVELQRVLRDRQQAFFQARHRNAVGRVGVDHAGQVVAGHVHGRMDGEAGHVHTLFAVLHGIVHGAAARVDLHQVRRLHLVEEHAVAVDQEVVGRARDACADVRVDQVRHAEVGDQAVQRGQVVPGLRFGILRVDGFERVHFGDSCAGVHEVVRSGC